MHFEILWLGKIETEEEREKEIEGTVVGGCCLSDFFQSRTLIKKLRKEGIED